MHWLRVSRSDNTWKCVEFLINAWSDIETQRHDIWSGWSEAHMLNGFNLVKKGYQELDYYWSCYNSASIQEHILKECNRA